MIPDIFFQSCILHLVFYCLFNNIPVIKSIPDTFNVLVILMPFACNKDNITITSHTNRFPDSLSPVRLYEIVLPYCSAFDIFNYIGWFFRPRVVRGYDHKVTKPCCYCAHRRPFATVSVSPATEDCDNATPPIPPLSKGGMGG